jgi:hypothetical protein
MHVGPVHQRPRCGRSIQSLDGMRTFAIALLLLSASPSIEACSLSILPRPWTGTEGLYVPDELAAAPPSLEVSFRAIHRPKIPKPGDVWGCDFYASFEVRVRANDNSVDLGRFGYLFKVTSARSPWTNVIGMPIQARIEGREAVFDLFVEDWGPSQRKPIDLELEVRAVNLARAQGRWSRFRVSAPVHSP